MVNFQRTFHERSCSSTCINLYDAFHYKNASGLIKSTFSIRGKSIDKS